MHHNMLIIDQILEDLDLLLNLTGMHAIYVQSSNGIADLRRKLLNADNVPRDGRGFYSGVTILAGGPFVPVFNTLFAAVGEG